MDTGNDIFFRKIRYDILFIVTSANIVMTPRDYSRPNLIDNTKKFVETIGFEWWDWHEDLIGLISELEEDGDDVRPYYDEVILLLSRQIGKSQIVACYLMATMLQYGLPSVVYTSLATSGAINLFADKMEYPLYDRFGEYSKTAGSGVQFNKSAARPAIIFHVNNGPQSMHILSSSKNAARGLSPHMAVFDEAFDLTDTERIRALRPALLASQFKQLIYASTAPQAHSEILHKLRNAALERIEKYNETGDRKDLGRTAYFECRAKDDVDIFSSEAMLQANPSLKEHAGKHDKQRRVTIQTLRSEMETYVALDDVASWKNEYLGLPQYPEDIVDSTFDVDALEQCSVEELKMQNSRVAAVITNPVLTRWFLSVSNGDAVEFVGMFDDKDELIDKLKTLKVTRIVCFDTDDTRIPNCSHTIANTKTYIYACHHFEQRLLKTNVTFNRHKILWEDLANAKKQVPPDGDEFRYIPKDREEYGLCALKSVCLSLYYGQKRVVDPEMYVF